jgi:hypothetical protein
MVWSRTWHNTFRSFSGCGERKKDTPHYVRVKRGNQEVSTNIDEFLSVRKGQFAANGGHDRLLACIEICVATWMSSRLLLRRTGGSRRKYHLWRDPFRSKLSCHRQRWRTSRFQKERKDNSTRSLRPGSGRMRCDSTTEEREREHVIRAGPRLWRKHKKDEVRITSPSQQPAGHCSYISFLGRSSTPVAAEVTEQLSYHGRTRI